MPFYQGSDKLKSSGIEPTSPVLQADSLLLSHQGSPKKKKKTILQFFFPKEHITKRIRTITAAQMRDQGGLGWSGCCQDAEE